MGLLFVFNCILDDYICLPDNNDCNYRHGEKTRFFIRQGTIFKHDYYYERQSQWGIYSVPV